MSVNNAPNKTGEVKSGSLSKNILYGSLIYAAIIFLVLLSIEITIWAHLLWMAWLLFIYLVYLGKIPIAMKVVWWLLILHVFLTFVVVGSVDTSSKNTSKPTETATQSTDQSSDTEQQTTATQSGKEVYDCQFNTSSVVSTPTGYVARVYSSPYIDNTYGEPRQITDTTVFYLSDFTASSTPKETMYFDVFGASDQFIPGVKIFIQVCNRSTNKSTSISELSGIYTSPTSDNTKGVEQGMSFVDAPDRTGDYRFDGIMTINDGDWLLVGRKDIQFK